MEGYGSGMKSLEKMIGILDLFEGPEIEWVPEAMAERLDLTRSTLYRYLKVLADAATDRILGVHMIGPHVGELIAEAAVIMEFGGSAEDLARTCHAHPTLSEAVKEAALSVAKRPIHM